MYAAPYAVFYRSTSSPPYYATEGTAAACHVALNVPGDPNPPIVTPVMYTGLGWTEIPLVRLRTFYSCAVVPTEAKWAVYNVFVYDDGAFYWLYPNWDKYVELR